MNADHAYIQANTLTVNSVESRSVCHQVDKSAPQICLTSARLVSMDNRCSLNAMGKDKAFQECLNSTGSTLMAKTAMVSKPIISDNRVANQDSSKQETAKTVK